MSTAIEWTDETWNPWHGCRKIAPECDHCYAAVFDSRRLHRAHIGVAKDGEWTGKITRSPPSVWQAPFKWKDGATIFTCSMSDFFHEAVPLGWLDEALNVIEATAHLTYQILTKRPGNVLRKLRGLKRDLPRNVWLGATVGHPQSLPLLKPLRRIDATLKFLSVEPLLAPMVPGLDLAGIGWAICGGENGLGARPCDPDWVRGVRDLCRSHRVPLFFKQWGTWENNPLYRSANEARHIDKVREAIRRGERGAEITIDAKTGEAKIVGSKGGATLDGRLWREFPESTVLIREATRASGRRAALR